MNIENKRSELVLDHPVFEISEDGKAIKGLILEFSNEKFETFEEAMMKNLTNNIFKGKTQVELSKQLQELNISFFSNCGKLIPHNSYFYRCLDCDKFRGMESTMITVMCKECYEKSNHLGHRVFQIYKEGTSTATCDCGDPACLEENGFCSDHKYIKVDPEEIIARFPEDLRNDFLTEFKKLYYLIFSLFEQIEHFQFEQKANILKLVFKLMDHVQIFHQSIQINKAFIFLISFLFKSTLIENQNIVWHNCDNLEELELNPLNPHPCKCSILQLLFRFMKNIPQELQTQYTDLCTELHRDDSFKFYLNQAFSQYLSFLLPKFTNKVHNPKQMPVYDIFRMNAQIYGTEELCLFACENKSIANFYLELRKIVDRAKYPAKIIVDQFDEVASIIGYYFYTHNKNAAVELVNKFKHFKEIFELIMNYHLKFIYQEPLGIGVKLPQINFELLNDILIFSRSLELLVEKGYRVIQFVPQEEIDLYLGDILKYWHEYYTTFRAVIEEEIKSNPNTLAAVSFERLFILMMIQRIRPLSKKNIEETLKHFFHLENSEQVDAFARTILESTLKNFGIYRYLQLVHSYSTGPIHNVYLFINNLIHEHDILTMQMMSLVVNRDNLFEIFVKSFFSHNEEIQNFILKGTDLIEDDYITQKVNLIEDFFFLINNLMNDELCYLSAQLSKKNENIVNQSSFQALHDRVIKKLLINLMPAFYWTNLGVIKANLRNQIRDYKDVDEILFEISDVDIGEKKLRLKSEYLAQFDPYFFYKTRVFQRDIVNHYSQRKEPTVQNDLVSGYVYTNLPEYLYEIQIQFFTSTLLNSLKTIILNAKANPEKFFGNVMRLMYLNLKLIDFIPNEEKKLELIKHFKATFEDSSFITKLVSLLNQENYAEYHNCIKNCFKLMNFFTNEIQSLFPVELKDKDKLNESDRKEMIRRRQIEIKAEFLKKQKEFAEKNLTESIISSQIIEEKQTSCKYCMEDLNNEKPYGVPVYVTFTGNFNSIYYKNDPASTFNKYMCMKTCGHHFHAECFEKLYEKIWIEGNFPRNQALYWNFLEQICPICKMLTNNFIILSEKKAETKEESKMTLEENKQDLEHKIITENEGQHNQGQSDEGPDSSDEDILEERTPAEEPLPKFTFLEKVVKVHTFSEDRNPMNTKSKVTSEEYSKIFDIAEKAFVYFLESTHMITSKTELQQRFMIYFYFLRELSPKSDGTINHDISQLLERIRKVINQDYYRCFELLEQDLIKICLEFLLNSSKNETNLETLKQYLIDSILLRDLVFRKILGSDSLYFKEKFYSSIQNPIEYITLTYLLSQALKEDCKWSDIESKLNILFNREFEEEKYLNQILTVFGDNNLVLESILQTNKEKMTQFNSLISIDHKMIEEKINPDVGFELKALPSFIDLPSNFQEFNSKYLTSKCYFCKEHKTENVICICLICGKTLCRRKCGEKEPKLGNLTVHSLVEHAGNAAFLSTNDLIVYLIASPKIIIYPMAVYVDRFGINVKDLLKESRNKLYSLDFKNISLNKSEVNKLKEVVYSGYGIPQKVQSVVSQSQYILRQGFY